MRLDTCLVLVKDRADGEVTPRLREGRLLRFLNASSTLTSWRYKPHSRAGSSSVRLVRKRYRPSRRGARRNLARSRRKLSAALSAATSMAIRRQAVRACLRAAPRRISNTSRLSFMPASCLSRAHSWRRRIARSLATRSALWAKTQSSPSPAFEAVIQTFWARRVSLLGIQLKVVVVWRYLTGGLGCGAVIGPWRREYRRRGRFSGAAGVMRPPVLPLLPPPRYGGATYRPRTGSVPMLASGRRTGLSRGHAPGTGSFLGS